MLLTLYPNRLPKELKRQRHYKIIRKSNISCQTNARFHSQARYNLIKTPQTIKHLPLAR